MAIVLSIDLPEAASDIQSVWIQLPFIAVRCFQDSPSFDGSFQTPEADLEKFHLSTSTDTSSFHHHSIHPKTAENVIDPLKSRELR